MKNNYFNTNLPVGFIIFLQYSFIGNIIAEYGIPNIIVVG